MIGLPEDIGPAFAVGWATVELERAARELGHLLAPGSVFRLATRSAALGARCRVGTWAGASRLTIVLLEPDTEGPLAGTLARFGEGWAATWVTSPSPRVPAATGAAAEKAPRSSARPGPLGAERLLPGDGASGRHRLIVDAVPSPP